MTAGWDPDAYLRFADERSRPFADLLARVDGRPDVVVDLGCGPGHLTGLLRARWPQARVLGVDSSPEMIRRVREGNDDPEVRYVQADLRDWWPDGPIDLLVSAATLQWVPGHLDLLPGLASAVAPGGSLALTVPANFDAPSHRLLRELAARSPYAAWTSSVEHPVAHDAATYLAALSRPGWTLDVWETTYLHVLAGPDPVLAWVSGTGARPVLQALPEALRGRFESEYAAALREAYSPGPHGTVLPFRRVFVVARRADGRRDGSAR